MTTFAYLQNRTISTSNRMQCYISSFWVTPFYLLRNNVEVKSECGKTLFNYVDRIINITIELQHVPVYLQL